MIRFINKHNIKWFERQQATNLNAHHENEIDSSPKQFNQSTDKAHLNLTFKQMINDTNNINRLSFNLMKLKTTVAPTKNPPILNQDIVTQQNTPAWKSLISKIVNSNTSDLDGKNTREIVNKITTNKMEQNNHDTTHFTTMRTTTAASVQQTTSEFRLSHFSSVFLLFLLTIFFFPRCRSFIGWNQFVYERKSSSENHWWKIE